MNRYDLEIVCSRDGRKIISAGMVHKKYGPYVEYGKERKQVITELRKRISILAEEIYKIHAYDFQWREGYRASADDIICTILKEMDK